MDENKSEDLSMAENYKQKELFDAIRSLGFDITFF